jgi:hypothetical protein
MHRIGVVLLALLALVSCGLFDRGKELEDGLRAAIERGRSPFLLSEAFPGNWTELCFFGGYDDGDHLGLERTYPNAWWLVAFDGERIVAKRNGLDNMDVALRLNKHNATRTCFTPRSRVTIVSAAERALRFEDGHPWQPKRK